MRHGILGSKSRGNLGVLGISSSNGCTNGLGTLGSGAGTLRCGQKAAQQALLARRSVWPPHVLPYASIASLGAVCSDAEIADMERHIADLIRRRDTILGQEVPALRQEFNAASNAANTAKDQVAYLNGEIARMRGILNSVPSGPDYAGERANIQQQMEQFLVPLNNMESAFMQQEARARGIDGQLQAKAIELDGLEAEITEMQKRRAACTGAPPVTVGPTPQPAPQPSPQPAAAGNSGLMIGAAIGLAALAGLYFMNQE